MATKNNKNKIALDLYLNGKDVTTIALTLGLSRATIYKYKKDDKWDDELLFHSTDLTQLENREKRFLSSLIKEYENSLDDLNGSDIDDKLDKLERYAKLYYKLKAQKDNLPLNKERIIKSSAREAILKISELAIKHNATETIKFLSDHADEIVLDVLKSLNQ